MILLQVMKKISWDRRLIRMETVLAIIVIIGFIFLLGIWSLTALYSLACDVNAEKRRERQEKRDAEYHKARMKELMK